jgi:acetyl-CoA synthetase
MTTTGSSATDLYRTSRDQLLHLRGDHARAAREFTFPDVGDRWNWGIDWFDAVARGNEAPCLTIVTQDESVRSWSWDEMAHRSDQVAAHLTSLGIGVGDPVVLMLGNQVELWESMLAVIKLGAVVMPTTTAAGPGDLVDRMERGGARAVVTNAAEVHKFEHVPGDYVRIAVGALDGASTRPVSSGASGWQDHAAAYGIETGPSAHPGTGPDDPMLLYFTSGTTSRPKLVEHTQQSYPVGHLSTVYWLGLQPGDTHLNISSPGWAKHAWSSFFAPWAAEATAFVYDYTRFDPAALLRVLRTHEVTSLCAPPTVWRMLITSDLSGGPGSLREIVAAGEPLNPEVITQVERAWGLTIRDGYGQTEMTAAVGNTPGSPVKPGSMGRPLPGCPVVVVDPVTNELVSEGGADGVREGEICLDLSQHPVPLMTGYQGDAVRNADAMAGGFYHTGDVASVDSEGYISFIGRTDDVFKASDYKISPFEVESVLIEHPAVAEAAVVPAPDPVRLAVPKAYIALAPGHEADAETARSILAHARAKLAPWQRVRRIEFYELPKTISGKIRRVELRSRESDLAAGGGESPTLEWRDEQFPELRG